MDSIKKLQELILKEKPEKCDAIVWLQGDRLDRAKKTLELYKKKYSQKIIISGNDDLIGPDKRPGEDNISLVEMKKYLLGNGVKTSDIIVENKSFNTRDQAKNIIELAVARSWSQLIIVGSFPHYQARYFLTFLQGSKELSWKGRLINQFVKIPSNRKPGGRDQTAKELLKEELKKINEYLKKRHLSSVKEGIDYLSKKITFKKATLKNARLLLKWRNDPQVRRNVFSQDVIKFKDHLNWMMGVLKDKKRFLYIIFNEKNKAIGQVRFDVEGSAEITIALAKEARGKGYGVIAIRNSSDFFLKKNPLNIKKIFARVLESNIASQRAFISAGYRQTKKEKNIIHFLYE